MGGPVFKNKTFFLVNYEGVRIKRGFSSFKRSHTGRARRPLFEHDHRSDHRAAVSKQHDSAVALLEARESGGTEVHAGAERQCAAGQLPADSHAAAGSGPVHRSASITISATTARSSAGSRRRPSATSRPAASAISATRVRAGFDELAADAHLGRPQQSREQFPSRPRQGDGQPGRVDPCGSCGCECARTHGVFTDLSDAQRAYPRINMNNYSQLGGGTNVTPRATSRCGISATP